MDQAFLAVNNTRWPTLVPNSNLIEIIEWITIVNNAVKKIYPVAENVDHLTLNGVLQPYIQNSEVLARFTSVSSEKDRMDLLSKQWNSIKCRDELEELDKKLTQGSMDILVYFDMKRRWMSSYTIDLTPKTFNQAFIRGLASSELVKIYSPYLHFSIDEFRDQILFVEKSSATAENDPTVVNAMLVEKVRVQEEQIRNLTTQVNAVRAQSKSPSDKCEKCSVNPRNKPHKYCQACYEEFSKSWSSRKKNKKKQTPSAYANANDQDPK